MKDIVLAYGISKLSPDVKVELAKAINCLVQYVQNQPVYYKTEPSLTDGVITFSIVGFKRDHHRLQKKLSAKLMALGCRLVWSDTITKI